MKVKENGALKEITGKRVWFSRLIASGLGSSAYYPGEVLESSGVNAFPKGTHIHADHQSWREWDEQPANSVKTIIGVIASDPQFYRAGETVVVKDKTVSIENEGLYAFTEYLEEWAPFVEQMHEYVGLSINSQVTVTGEDHVSGLPIVESFVYTPVNTVDLVTVPGAKGKILHAIESGILVDKENIREDQGMTPEEIVAVAEALSKALVPAITEVLQPAKVEDEDQVNLSEVAEVVIAADLPEAARRKVYSVVEAGGNLQEAIDAEKEYIETLQESIGVFKSGGPGDKTEDFSVAGWSK